METNTRPVSFRKFKIPQPAESGFFISDESVSREFMIQDLARSGLTPDDIQAYTSGFLRKQGASAAYGIPYFDLNGEPIVDPQTRFPAMFRGRFKFPEFSKEQRYTQPNREQLAKWGLPPFIPYIHPLTFSTPGETIVCCEGEKKTAAVIKYLGLPAFGIGGCQMWRNPDGSGSIHPWIRKILASRVFDSITIVPDADIQRYDICNAYGTFAAALESEGIKVEILSPPGKIDDLLVEWGGKASDNFTSLPRLNSKDLVQSSSSLIKRHSLAFKTDAKGNITVYQHTANVMKLMEEHNAFPKIWRNNDNGRVMVGEGVATPDLTEMEIANYFQYNLGFDKVSAKTIFSCIQALARRNSRSPFLEYVRNIQWDGQHRLETWLTDYWGVADVQFVREIAAKWLISACARMDKPGCKIDWMMIVIGPQGTGKTTMPSILFRNHSTILYGDQNNKDFHMILHSGLVAVFDELDSFGKRETSTLKAMITTNEDTFRPPYAASVDIFPRRFTLYGCGNRHNFLQHDPSGYRRYAIVEVGRILDFEGLKGAIDQLWAEAWSRYQDGNTDYWEVKGASEHAEEFVAPNAVEEEIRSWIESQKVSKSGTSVKDGIFYFTMAQLLRGVQMEHQVMNSNFTREVSAILQSMGVVRKSCRPPWGGGAIKLYAAHI